MKDATNPSDIPAAGAPGPIDTCAWIGGYPWREIPHPEPQILVRVLAREGFSGAWVGHLPGAFHRDPAPTNAALLEAVAPHQGILHPVPTVRPDWPGWERQLAAAVDAGAPAIRAYPMLWGYGAGHPALEALARAAGEAGVVLQLPVRFEDLRQRHPLDTAGDLSAAHVRSVARLAGSRAHLVVSGAGREMLEEIHWGLTPEEQARVWYDWHWIWGPPEDHFAHLVATVGPERLVWSSWWPLRLTQQAQALVDLLPTPLPGPLPDGSPESLPVSARREHTPTAVTLGRFADGATIRHAASTAAGLI